MAKNYVNVVKKNSCEKMFTFEMVQKWSKIGLKMALEWSKLSLEMIKMAQKWSK